MDVHAKLVAAPLPTEFGGSYYSKTTRETVIVTLETDTDIVGRIYAGDFGDVGREQGLKVLKMIQEDLAPLLEGKS
jgi:L-alanine-DL-glutamate epimerase-like enolase superfamily enzyme